MGVSSYKKRGNSFEALESSLTLPHLFLLPLFLLFLPRLFSFLIQSQKGKRHDKKEEAEREEEEVEVESG